MIPLALSVLGYGKMLAQAAMSWLSKRSLAEILCIALGLALAVDHIALLSAHRHARKVEAQLSKAVKARLNDRAAYVNAQAAATAANKAHVATENKLREQINEASHTSFSADRDRLRAQSGASQGTPGSAGVSPVPKAAPGTPPEVVSLPPAELLRAQELELQLNALIDWVLQQSAIDPNKP